MPSPFQFITEISLLEFKYWGKLKTIDTRKLATEVSILTIATSVRPPQFSAKPGDDVESWMQKFEVIAKALEWDKARDLTQVLIYLVSFGASWHNRTTKDRTLSCITTWSLLKTLIAMFQTDYQEQFKESF